MACPAPAAEPGPNWLDRLRSSKGFPPHHAGLDLDHFLLHHPDPDPDPDPEPNPNPSPPTPQDHHHHHHQPSFGSAAPPQHREEAPSPGGEGKAWFQLMSSALAELFHMGDPRGLPALRGGKKNPRKQPNPRICVASSRGEEQGAGGGGLPATSPPSAENSIAGAKKWPGRRTKARRKRALRTGAAESLDLSAYSCTEVTVIDTSSPSWKSQKIIFRKGLVWKVRDKKLWSVCRKKRRLGVAKRLANEQEQEELLLAERREVLIKEHLASSDDGYVHNDRRDVSKDTSYNQNQIPGKRVQFPRSSRRPIAKDPSVPCL